MCNRIYVELEAELFSYYSTHTAFIENISEYGMYVKVISDKNTVSGNPNLYITLRLKLQSDNLLELNCKKIWSHKTTANSLIERMGLQIINPPDEYKDFYQTISAG